MRRQLARLILRRYPFMSGYTKALDSKPGRYLSRLAGEVHGPIWARARGGIELQVLPSDEEGRCIDLLGDWDPRIGWTCRRILRPGDTFVDVGTNFGLESLVGARQVGPTGRVHAFEPQPEIAAMLRRSAERNQLNHLTVHEIALSNEDGERVLYIPNVHTGAASLCKPHETGAGAGGLQVKVRRADGFFREQGIESIRLLKLDVEGHEAAVLEGSEPFFSERPPAAVLFESNAWFEGLSRGLSAADFPFAELPVVRFLRERSYRFYAFGRSYFRVNLYRVAGDAPRHPPVSDLLAIHESHAAELVPILKAREHA